MTHPSLKYHTGLCFSLYKSNKGYRSGREPLLSGTGNALHHRGENTEGSSGETSASVCPHTPAVDPCAGDFAKAKPENKANTVRSRYEPLTRAWHLHPCVEGNAALLCPLPPVSISSTHKSQPPVARSWHSHLLQQIILDCVSIYLYVLLNLICY